MREAGPLSRWPISAIAVSYLVVSRQIAIRQCRATSLPTITRVRGWSPVQLGIQDPRRTNRPLTALATRLTLIHEEGQDRSRSWVLTAER
jgi:hypothetical protein